MKCASLSYSKAWTILIHAVRAQPLDRQAEVDQCAGSSVDLFHQQIESIVDFDPVRLALCLLQILFPEQKKKFTLINGTLFNKRRPLSRCLQDVDICVTRQQIRVELFLRHDFHDVPGTNVTMDEAQAKEVQIT